MSTATAPTKLVTVDGTDFAYREVGPAAGIPLVLLQRRGHDIATGMAQLADSARELADTDHETFTERLTARCSPYEPLDDVCVLSIEIL